MKTKKKIKVIHKNIIRTKYEYKKKIVPLFEIGDNVIKALYIIGTILVIETVVIKYVW
jgi:hypothetical protein